MRPGSRIRARILVSILGGLILTAAAADAQPKPIRIGEINSYSGVATVYTFPYKEGLALATKEINEAGGVLGRPLEFIHRDDKLKPDEAVKAARELVLQDKVDFLAGCISSGVGLAISAYAKDAKVLYFATHCQTSRLTWDDGHPLRRPHHQQRQPVRAGRRQEGVDLARQEVGEHFPRLRVRPQHVGGVLHVPEEAQARCAVRPPELAEARRERSQLLHHRSAPVRGRGTLHARSGAPSRSPS